MKVSCTYAGQVRSPLHAYMQHFGMHLETLYSKYDLHSGILKFLRPLYIGLLVKTGQKLNDHCHLLAVAGSSYESPHHFGVFGQAVEGNLDTAHITACRSLVQHPYE